MFKDYHYIFRCMLELRNKISEDTIVEIFSQEKDKICFHIPSSENPARHLIISCSPQLPFLILRTEFNRAKKNTVNFFGKSLPAKITDLRIAKDDRIINISTDKCEMFYTIRGGNSNFVCIDKLNEIESFKKITASHSGLIDELLSKIYINDFGDYSLPSAVFTSGYELLKTKLPVISKKLFFEIRRRIESVGTTEGYDIAVDCVNEIIHENILVTFDDETSELIFQPNTFAKASTETGNDFADFNQAVQYYIVQKFKHNNYSQTKKLVQSNIEKEIGALANKLNNLKSRVEKGSKENEYYKCGNIILSNLDKIENNIQSIELTDYTNNEDVKIKLDPKLNAAENANFYFEKAKDEKKNYKKSVELYETTKNKYERYINFRNRIASVSALEEMVEIKKQLNLHQPSDNKKVEDKISYREYLLDNKYRVFVGRDSKSNDLLTVKYAKQNDYWFHARGLPGSHVVLRVDNPKEGIPKNILNDTASIAAFYSKAKTAKVAPVAYTLRKFVRKNKNMNPGQVLLSKESVLLVKPGIPKNAVVIEE